MGTAYQLITRKGYLILDPDTTGAGGTALNANFTTAGDRDEQHDAQIAQLQADQTTTADSLTAHASDKNNPHQVTAEQVGAYSKSEIDQTLGDYATADALAAGLNAKADASALLAYLSLSGGTMQGDLGLEGHALTLNDEDRRIVFDANYGGLLIEDPYLIRLQTASDGLGINIQSGNLSADGQVSASAIHSDSTVTAATLSGSLNATYLTGSIADARLSSNVPLKNAANVFSTTQTIATGTSTLTLSASTGVTLTDSVGPVFALDNSGNVTLRTTVFATSAYFTKATTATATLLALKHQQTSSYASVYALIDNNGWGEINVGNAGGRYMSLNGYSGAWISPYIFNLGAGLAIGTNSTSGYGLYVANPTSGSGSIYAAGKVVANSDFAVNGSFTSAATTSTQSVLLQTSDLFGDYVQARGMGYTISGLNITMPGGKFAVIRGKRVVTSTTTLTCTPNDSGGVWLDNSGVYHVTTGWGSWGYNSGILNFGSDPSNGRYVLTWQSNGTAVTNVGTFFLSIDTALGFGSGVLTSSNLSINFNDGYGSGTLSSYNGVRLYTTQDGKTQVWGTNGLLANGLILQNAGGIKFTNNLQFVDQSNGAVLVSVNGSSSGTPGVNVNTALYVTGKIGVGNTAAATTPGTVIRRLEVFDANGASLGFVPIYNSIS